MFLYWDSYILHHSFAHYITNINMFLDSALSTVENPLKQQLDHQETLKPATETQIYQFF